MLLFMLIIFEAKRQFSFYTVKLRMIRSVLVCVFGYPLVLGSICLGDKKPC